MGATVANIIGIVSKEFLIIVAVAGIVASPIAYFTMNSWLQGFAYRAEITIDVFFYAGIAAVIIALLSVGYQAVKAAVSDPVKSLRYE